MRHKGYFLLILLLIGVATSCWAANSAIQFNAAPANEYIMMGTNQFNPLFGGATGLSFEGWIKPSSFAGVGSRNIIFNAGLSGSTVALFVCLRDNGLLQVGGRSGVADAVFQNVISPAAVGPLNSWVHVAGVLNFAAGQKSVKAYVNDQLVQQAVPPAINFANNAYVTNPAPPVGTNDTIGGNPAVGTFDAFLGQVEEFKVWTYARTQAQIQADMYKDLSLPQANLAAYWKFDTGAGLTAFDSSTHG